MASKKEKNKDSKSKPKKKKGNFFIRIFKFLFFLCIFAGAVVLFRNSIVKTVLSRGLSAITGVNLQIGYLDISLRQPIISIKEVRLYNPVGFEDEFMAYAPEIFIQYDPKGFLKGKFNFERINLDLKQLHVLKNTKGEINLHALKALKRKPKEGEIPLRRWRIDRLDLSLGKVIYKDYTKAGPLTKEFEVNMKEHFDNLDPKGLIRVIVWKALTKTAIAKLINFDVTDLENMITNTIMTAPVAVPQMIIEETSNTLKKAADGVTSLIKKPFDKKNKAP